MYLNWELLNYFGFVISGALKYEHPLKYQTQASDDT